MRVVWIFCVIRPGFRACAPRLLHRAENCEGKAGLASRAGSTTIAGRKTANEGETHERPANLPRLGLQHLETVREQDPRRYGGAEIRFFRRPCAGCRRDRLHDAPADRAMGPRVSRARL